MSQHDTLTWPQAIALSDVPDVHEALTAFGHDNTSDNAVGLVMAIYRAIQPAQAAQSEPVHACPSKDIVCGDRPENWCATCPKRKAQTAQDGPVLVLYRREIGEGDWAPCTPEQYADASGSPHWDTKTESVGKQPAVAQGAGEVVAADAEREECAKLCDHIGKVGKHKYIRATADHLAYVIRQRDATHQQRQDGGESAA